MSAPWARSERPKAKIEPLLEQPRRPRPRALVLGLEDRPEPEDRDLPRVPVGEPVEGGDLAELADPLGVPASLGIAAAVAGRGQEPGEDPLLRLEGEVVGVPAVLAVGVLERDLPAVLEPLDRRPQPRLVAGLEVRRRVGVRVEDQPVAGRVGIGGGRGVGLGCALHAAAYALTVPVEHPADQRTRSGASRGDLLQSAATSGTRVYRSSEGRS